MLSVLLGVVERRVAPPWREMVEVDHWACVLGARVGSAWERRKVMERRYGGMTRVDVVKAGCWTRRRKTEMTIARSASAWRDQSSIETDLGWLRRD